MSLACRELTAFAVLVRLTRCVQAGDSGLMQEAQAACSRLANTYLEKNRGGQSVTLPPQRNTSSDPTPNAFEFIWDERAIVGDPAAEPRTIWCQGAADQKVITLLRVGHDQVVAFPQTY